MLNLKKQKWLWGSLFIVILILMTVLILYSRMEYEKMVLTQYNGDYVMGDGMFMSCSLTINSNKHFVLSRSSDTSDEKVVIQGNVTISRDSITLIPSDWSGPKLPCVVNKLILVVWDSRAYLMPDDGDEFSKTILARFCNNVRDNFELKSEKMGSVFPYIKTQDLEKIRSTGRDITSNTMPTKFSGKPLCAK